MGMMDEMMDAMMGMLSKAEKLEMMSTIMEKFLAGFTVEDKQKMMPKMMEGVNMMEMMPKMMMNMMGGNGGEGGMMGMMSKMMGGGEGSATSMMPATMMETMMPQCIKTFLPKMTKEKRIDFALNIASILVEQGSSGLSKKEKKDFVSKMIEKVSA